MHPPVKLHDNSNQLTIKIMAPEQISGKHLNILHFLHIVEPYSFNPCPVEPRHISRDM